MDSPGELNTRFSLGNENGDTDRLMWIKRMIDTGIEGEKISEIFKDRLREERASSLNV